MNRDATRSTLGAPAQPNRYVSPTRLLVPALSLTLLLSWGSLYYGFAMLAHPLQQELRWSAPSVMGAYSVALLFWGLCTYHVGKFVDRHGGRLAMTLGSCLCGVLFFALSRTGSLWSFFLIWAGLGVGMALTLYEPAFAVLVETWPHNYRRRLGVLTLAGGLASTVFWPLTHWLVAALGWRGTVLIYAAIHLFVCAPVHALALPARRRRSLRVSHESSLWSTAPGAAFHLAMRSPAFWLLATSFAAFGFVTAAMATHVVPMVESKGMTTAAAVAIASWIGPMQVVGRSVDLLLAGRWSPFATGLITVALIPIAMFALWTASGALALLCASVALYGAGLGLLTIVRATTPVELFWYCGLCHHQRCVERSVHPREGGRPTGGYFIDCHGPSIRRGVAVPAGLRLGRRGGIRVGHLGVDGLNATFQRFNYPSSVIQEYRSWVVMVRPAQVTLGCTVIAATSACTSLGDLTPEEAAELPQVIRDFERTIRRLAPAAKFNYLALMMVDPNPHFHAIPRYGADVHFEGMVFSDAAFPSPPALTCVNALTTAQLGRVRRWLQEHWPDGPPQRAVV